MDCGSRRDCLELRPARIQGLHSGRVLVVSRSRSTSEPPVNSAFPRVGPRAEFRADACLGRQIIGISSGHDVGLAAAGPCLDLGKLACNQDERLHGLLGIALLQIRIRLEEL
jgi:hypothetical protein